MIAKARPYVPDFHERPSSWAIIVSVPVVYVIAVALLVPTTSLPEHKEYDFFKHQLQAGSVKWVSTVNTGQFIDVGLKNGHQFVTRRPQFGDPELEHELEAANVQINPLTHSALAWDIVVSATPFGTLSAVLAGFVFIGIIGILTLPPHGDDKPRPPLAVLNEQIKLPLLALVQAFLTLVDAGFLFSVLAGESSGAGRIAPVFAGFLPSWLLALGVVQMAVAIAWILYRYEHVWPVVLAGNWIAYFAVGLALVSTAGVLVTPVYDQPSIGEIGAGLAWGFAAIPVWAGCVALGWRWNSRSSITPYFLTWPMIIAVGLVTAAYVALTAFGSETNVAQYFPLFFRIAVAWQVALGGLCGLYLAGLPPDADKRSLIGLATNGSASNGRNTVRTTNVTYPRVQESRPDQGPHGRGVEGTGRTRRNRTSGRSDERTGAERV